MASFDLSLETLKSTLFKIVRAGTQFGTSVLAAQLLRPELFGAVYVILRIGITASTVVTGWADGVKKRFAEGSLGTDQALGELLTVAVVWTGVALVLGLVVRGPLATLTTIPGAWLLVWMVVLSESFSIALVKFFEAKGRLGVGAGMKSLRYLLALPLQIGLLVLGQGATGFIGGFLVATALAVPVPVLLLDLSVSRPTVDQFRAGWVFAKYSIPNATIGATYHILDIVILSAVLTTAAAGHYEAAWALTMPGMFIAAAAASGLIVKVSDMAERDADVARVIERTISYTSFVAIPVFFGALVIGDPLVVSTFGSEYRPAGTLLVGLAAFQVVRTQVAPLLQATYGQGRPDLVTRITVLSVALNVTLGVGLTLVVGALGVVIATVLIESVRYLWLARYIRRENPSITLLPRAFLKQGAAGAVMAGVLWSASRVVSPTGLLAVLAFVGLGGCVYGTVAMVIDARLRSRVRSALPVAGSVG